MDLALRLCRYRICRRTALLIVVLFFINLFIITQLVDVQSAWTLFTKKPVSLFGTKTTGQEADKINIPTCAFSEPLTRSAIARMQTESCRLRAINTTCNLEREIPDSLPNSCPYYRSSMRGTYIGCFLDNDSLDVLDGHHYKIRNNTPTHCITMCFRTSYRYAGVKLQKECFCGDSIRNATTTHDSYCRQYLCANSSTQFCGGDEAIAVYSTGIDEKTVPVASYAEASTAEADARVLFLLQFNGRDIRQIARLLRLIYSSKHYYVIHVDSRQKFLFEEIKKVESLIKSSGFNNVHVMEKRYATIWAGISLLSMVLDALHIALYQMNWKSWDFLLNLSESDFPVLSLAELEFHLARNIGYNFLSSHGYDTARFLQKQGLDYIFMQCESRMWRLSKRKKYPDHIRLDGGSDWIVISREFAEFALSDEVLPRGLRIFFSSVLLPVESFFHTLAINSRYCTQTLKGNLRLTNWKRKQGCRCTALRKVVDWCGCSPLVFRSNDLRKFSLEAAKSKTIFFGRKFDSVISQSAIAAAERQSLRYTSTMLFADHPSSSSTWINVYTAEFDKSELLILFAKSLYRFRRTCVFGNLSAIYAYKENDETNIQTITELIFNCVNGSVRVQVLIEPKLKMVLKNVFVDGYTLTKIDIGVDFDYKEEVFRRYYKVFSEEDAFIVKMSWHKMQKSLLTSYTSPVVVVQWRNGNELVKRTVVQPYDSIYGGQFSELYANESRPGEWTVEVHTFTNETEHSIGSFLASVKFVIFAANKVNESLVSDYYKILDACSERDGLQLRHCKRTSWSSYYPDPKSQLFL